jgi:hypothetical protein
LFGERRDDGCGEGGDESAERERDHESDGDDDEVSLHQEILETL